METMQGRWLGWLAARREGDRIGRVLSRSRRPARGVSRARFYRWGLGVTCEGMPSSLANPVCECWRWFTPPGAGSASLRRIGAARLTEHRAVQ